MDIDIKPGKYVLAVSGGVDSMVLLDLLAGQIGFELIVAHFEHGIRTDSDEDRELVEQAAQHHNLPFIYERGDLGARASEATARAARYAFLRKVKEEQGAAAIVTAHHQDDVLETAIINMIRGTGPRGLSSLQSTDEIIRPLLALPKQTLLTYATENKLTWHEDSTNQDQAYLRNRVRRTIAAKMAGEHRAKLLNQVTKAAALNQEINEIVADVLGGRSSQSTFDREWFISLPYDVSAVVLAIFLRQRRAQFDRKSISRLVVFSKTKRPGQRLDVDGRHYLEIGKKHITLGSRP